VLSKELKAGDAVKQLDKSKIKETSEKDEDKE